MLSGDVSWQLKDGRYYIARIDVYGDYGEEPQVQLIIQTPRERRSPLDGSLVLTMAGEPVCRLEPGAGGPDHMGVPTPHLHYLDEKGSSCCEPFEPRNHNIWSLEDAARWFVKYCGIQGWLNWCDPP